MVLLLHVDDMLVTGPNLEEIKFVKSILNILFDMKDLGSAKKILGMTIERNIGNLR